MFDILVRKCEPAETLDLTREFDALFEGIRDRAYDLFEASDFAMGRDLDNWLEAEREFVWRPPAELTQSENEYRITMAAPGFDPDDVEVKATDEFVLVNAKTAAKTGKKNGNVLFSDFGRRNLFRRFVFPDAIDPDKVTATLAKGELIIVAARKKPVEAAKDGKPKRITVAA